MKRAIVFMALSALFLFSFPALAQTEQPPIDIFGAYSHVSNFDVGQSGWLASANYDVNDWFGLEGDLSGNYGQKEFAVATLLPGVPEKINSRMHSFNAGPRITWRESSGRINAFGHVLFGFSHTNVNAAGAGDSDTSFSWALGGAGDYYFVPKFGARLQLDLLRTNFFSKGDTHPRVAIGLVYRLGNRDNY